MKPSTKNFIVGIVVFVFAFSSGSIVGRCVVESEYKTDLNQSVQVFSDIDYDKDEYIKYVATIDKTYVINSGSTNLYIVDKDRHIFVFNFDNPEMLLLDNGDKLAVYIPIKYAEDDVIPITMYQQFGYISE